MGGIIAWLQTEPGKAALAGAAGGLVRWLTLREHPRDGMVSLLVGAICAVYLGPIAEPLLEPLVGAIAPQRDGGGFAAFVTGLGGIGLTGMLIDTLRRFRAEREGGADGR